MKTVFLFAAILVYAKNVECMAMMNVTLPSINDFRVMNRLPEITWNKTLETTAEQWIAGCPTHSPLFSHMIHITHEEEAFYLPKVVKNAINQWANDEVTNKQLMWDGTRYIGCAISTCQHSMNVVIALGCVYSPIYM